MANKKEHNTPIHLIVKVLSGEAKAEDLHALDTWKDASPENNAEFTAIQKLWNSSSSENVKHTINIDAEWKIQKQKINATKTIRLFSPLKIAASILIIVALSIISYQQLFKQKLKTQLADTTNTSLPDGSTISLNENSTLKYNRLFSRRNRTVELKGEAYFNVEKDKSLPFRIKAHNSIIEVVGTRFNVDARNEQLTVTVFEGTVWLYTLYNSTDTITITAGEKIIMAQNAQKPQKLNIENKNDISWITKEFEFNNTPLDEALATLTNAYHIKMLASDNVKNCPITVEFKNLELKSIVTILSNTLDLSTKKKNNTIIFDGKGCDN